MTTATLGQNMKRFVNNTSFYNKFVVVFDGIFIQLIKGVTLSFFGTTCRNVIFV